MSRAARRELRMRYRRRSSARPRGAQARLPLPRKTGASTPSNQLASMRNARVLPPGGSRARSATTAGILSGPIPCPSQPRSERSPRGAQGVCHLRADRADARPHPGGAPPHGAAKLVPSARSPILLAVATSSGSGTASGIPSPVADSSTVGSRSRSIYTRRADGGHREHVLMAAGETPVAAVELVRRRRDTRFRAIACRRAYRLRTAISRILCCTPTPPDEPSTPARRPST